MKRLAAQKYVVNDVALAHDGWRLNHGLNALNMRCELILDFLNPHSPVSYLARLHLPLYGNVRIKLKETLLDLLLKTVENGQHYHQQAGTDENTNE